MIEVTTRPLQSGRGMCVALSGELDISTAPDVERELAAVEAAGPGELVLDLSDLRFVDSTGLRLVLAADARARRDGRRLVVVPGPPGVHRVFRIALLDKRLEFLQRADVGGYADA